MEKIFRFIDFILILVGFLGLLVISISVIKNSAADNMLSSIPVIISFASVFIAGYLRFDRKKL